MKIEFHGCTTRDMCPLCYTNMNCMQFLANQKQGVGFLGALLERLKTIGCADDSTSSVTFISSLEEFPSKKDGDGGNLLWVTEDESVSAIVPGFVYQFRFNADQKTAIRAADKKLLRREVGITDLSSLSSALDAGAASALVASPEPFAAPSATGTPPSPTEIQETIPTELAKAGYKIQNVPGDGNCGVWAVLVASGRITLEELSKLMAAYIQLQKQCAYSPNWCDTDCQKALSNASSDATKKMVELREKIGNPGDWIDNTKDLPKISEALGKPIVVVYTIDGLPIYTLYSSTEIIDLKGSIGQIKLEHSNAIFIYYAHNHYQAIVKQ